MKQKTKILKEEYKKHYKSNKEFMLANDWTKAEAPYSVYETERSIIKNMLDSFSSFLEEIETDRYLKDIEKFVKEFAVTITIHIKRIEEYMNDSQKIKEITEDIEKLTLLLEDGEASDKAIRGELKTLNANKGKEVKFRNDIFSDKVSTKLKMAEMRVSDDSNIEEISPDLYFSDMKASLLMRPILTKVDTFVERRTNALEIDFSAAHINPATSNEMLINMKPSDIPPYDPTRHFFEQEKSTIQFWEEEKRKAIEGIVIGGYHIHPFLYWHLNLFKTSIGSGHNKRVTHPNFWDNDFYFVEMLKKAEKIGNVGIFMYGTRRASKSVKMTSFTQWKLHTIPNATGSLIGFSKEDLTAILDYTKINLQYMHPAFKTELLLSTMDSGIQLGVRHKNGREKFVLGSTLILNLEGGSAAGGLKTASATPDFLAIDEAGKGGVIPPWEAAKASFTEEDSENWRTIPLLSGCVCAGTKVYTHTGELINIEDLHKSHGILGFDKEKQMVTKEPITWMQPPSEKPCYRITTRKGHVLECSYEHPVLTRFRNKREKRGGKLVRKVDFVPAEELKVGQQIVLAESVDIWGSKKMWEPRVVGWFIGDGYYPHNGIPSLTSCDSEINDYIDTKFETSVKKKETITKDGKVLKQRRLKGTGKYLRKLGIFEQVHCNKTLPKDLYKYSKEDLAELVGGLFDTDGHVTIKGTSPQICFTTKCENLILEIRDLLNKFGVHPTYNKVISKPNKLIKKETEYYVLSIADKRSVNCFYNSFKFKIQYKQEVLEKAVEILKNKKEQIPQELDNCRLDTISNIEFIGSKPIYNLTAGKTNTYLANMIVTHNTAGNDKLSEDAEKMLSNPEAFNILPMDWDLYDEHIEKEYHTWEKENFALFVPAQMSLKGPRKRQTDLGTFLGDGNKELKTVKMFETDWPKANKYFEEERKKLEKAPETLAAEQKNFPLTPSDCLISTEYNPYPALEAKKRRIYIDDNEETGRRVDLFKDMDGVIKAQNSSKEILTEYPFRGGNFDAPVVLLDEIEEGKIPKFGLYVIGLDDIKHNRTSGDSVYSVSMFKRGYDGGEFGNRFAGYYHTRPNRKEDAYKQTYYLMKMYNCIVNPENDDEGFVEWVSANHPEDLYHIADGIDFANFNNMHRNSNRKFGTSTDPRNILFIERKLQSYMKSDKFILNEVDGLLGVQVTNDPMLLEEIYKYKPKNNADRLRSAALAYSYANFLDKFNIHMYLSDNDYYNSNIKRHEEKPEEISIWGQNYDAEIKIW